MVADTFFKGSLDLFCFYFCLLLPVSLLFLPSNNSNINSQLLEDNLNSQSSIQFSCFMFLIVASITGPKTLIGINIREIVPEQYGGLATGVIGAIGQLGSIIAGSGVALTLQHFGWQCYLTILLIASLLTIFLNLISYLFCTFPIKNNQPSAELKKSL